MMKNAKILLCNFPIPIPRNAIYVEKISVVFLQQTQSKGHIYRAEVLNDSAIKTHSQKIVSSFKTAAHFSCASFELKFYVSKRKQMKNLGTPENYPIEMR